MTTAPSLEDRVAHTLAAQAATISPAPGEFDASLVSVESTDDLGLGSSGTRRVGGRRLAKAALLVGSVAACVVVTVLALSGRTAHRAQVSTSPATTPAEPPVGLAPSWSPPGVEPVAASATRLLGGASFDGREQLFGSSGGQPQLLVALTPGSVGGGSGTPTVVRGLAGRLSPAKEFSGSSSTLLWDEGAAVQATYRGISLAQAQSLLGSLRWASPTDHLQGFAVPAGGPAVLLGQSATPTVGITQLEFDYADRLGSQTVGQGRQLMVRTSTAAGSLTSSYLSTWLEGTRAADGTVESYDPAFGTLSRVRLDGSSIWIDANATAISQADEKRVADGVVPLSEAEFTRREGQVATTIAAQLPLVAATDLGSDRVELRGDADLRTVCLHSSDTTFCSAATTASSGVIQGSFLVDGHWTVVAVASTSIEVTPDSPTLSGTSGAWSFVEVRPGLGVINLMVTAASQGVGGSRPAA